MFSICNLLLFVFSDLGEVHQTSSHPPEASVPLQGRQGSRGCIPEAPGATGIHLEWKQSTPLCSRMATGISWSSLGGLKGVKPPAFTTIYTFLIFNQNIHIIKNLVIFLMPIMEGALFE